MNTPRRILVVDDEPVVTRSCERILSDAGYSVTTTHSGREGLDRAVSSDFDLVLTDLKMPDLDGLELVRALKIARPDTAVVIITGYGTVNSAVAAMKLGVAEYVEKPFTPDEIADAVRDALPPAGPQTEPCIEASAVRDVLQQAADDDAFAERLLTEGSRVLAGLPLSSEAKAALVAGDLAWLEKRLGTPVTAGECAWLTRRLQAERW